MRAALLSGQQNEAKKRGQHEKKRFLP